MNLLEMVNARNVLLEQRDALDKLIKEQEHDIACLMISEGTERAYGDTGIGYSLNRPVSYKPTPTTQRLADDAGVSALFLEWKFSKTKLDDLFKKGEINADVYGDMIKSLNIEEGAIGLRKVVNKEMVVK